MIGLIITGHGHFATGLTSSLTLIAGNPKNYKAIDFPQEYSVEDLEKELHQAMDELAECEGILVLSDLAGGSPFKSAVICSIERKNINVISGTNLPMLIEIAMAREFITDVEDLTNMALQTGKDQIVRYTPNVTRSMNEEMEDGI